MTANWGILIKATISIMEPLETTIGMYPSRLEEQFIRNFIHIDERDRDTIIMDFTCFVRCTVGGAFLYPLPK